jgi:hypothetical protein
VILPSASRLDEHAHHLPPVPFAALGIVEGGALVSRAFSGVVQPRLVEALAAQGRLGVRGAQGRHPRAGQADPHFVANRVISGKLQAEADADQCGVDRPEAVLDIGRAKPWGMGRQMDRCQQLIGSQHRLHVVREERLDGKPPAALAGGDLYLGVQGNEGSGGIAGRVGVTEIAADGAHSSHRRRGHDGRGFGQRLIAALNVGIAGEVMLGNHGADRQPAVRAFSEFRQPRDAPETYQRLRGNEPESEQNEQRLPAGQHLHIVAEQA